MKKQQKKWLVGLISLGLAACSSTDIKVQSQVALPTSYEQAQWAAANEVDLSQWWKSWQDPVLSQLIEQGLEQNFALQAAKLRYEAASHMADLARRDLLPLVGAGGNVGYHDMKLDSPLSDSSAAILGAVLQSNVGQNIDVEGKHYAYGVSASWQPDVFGGKRSDADAAQASALGVQEAIYGAQMLVSSAIAENYLSFRSAQQRLVVLDNSIATMAQLKRYVEGRFKAGQATRFEVDDVGTQLAALKAKRAPLLALMNSHEKQIAVLVAQDPVGYQLPNTHHKTAMIQAPIPSGQMPSDLLLKRPDLRAHEHTITALSAQLASAKADLLPRFYMNFNALDGQIGIGSGSSVSAYGSIASLGVHMPIFTAGRIKANIAASNARLNAAAASFDDAILKALAEVQIAYTAQYQLNQSAQQWQSAYQAATRQANQANKLYQHGEKLLSDVLLARLNALSYQDQYLQTQLMSNKAAVGVYQALGGGWKNDSEKQ